MFTNRFFNLFVAVALLAVIALTTREAIATSAVMRADRTYDQVEQVRDQRLTSLSAVDHSYDAIENVRGQRFDNTYTADRSYDAIENLRAQRTSK